MLFNYYDTDGSGSLDYKEFTSIIVDKSTTSSSGSKKANEYG